jgi:hypothetical protein
MTRNVFKVAIIDDQIGTLFPESRREALRSRGFSIEYFKDIRSLNEIEKHHIVMCDVVGVGKNMAVNKDSHGGLIVQDLRKSRPMAYIIMFSGAASYDPEFNRYFNIADEIANLSSIAGERIVVTLDKCMDVLRSPGEQWKRFNKYVLASPSISFPAKDIEKLKKYFLAMSPQESANFEFRGARNTPKNGDDSEISSVDMALDVSELASRLMGIIG